MTNPTLPSSTFKAPSLGRRGSIRNTVIEDMPQVSIRRVAPQAPVAKTGIVSPMSDDFPTPRAIPQTGNSVASLYPPLQDIPASPASSDTQSDRNSTWSKRTSGSEFDELYDLSSSENEDFPIKLSSSVKRRVAGPPKSRYPSIVIPSPSQWPSIQKLKSASTPLSPPHQVQLSPAVLAHFQDRSLRVPSTTSAPSLDGSMTSEELAASSCPSTPDISLQQVENAWEGTVQLAPSAISMLRHINTEEEHPLETVLEVPEEAVSEMREIIESPRFALQLRTDDRTLEPSSAGDADDELSALSVPSPGGFFSSLDASLGRRTWSGAEIVPNTSTAAEFYGVPFKSPQPSLPTSTATSFYNVPWANRPERPVEHIVALASPASEKQDPVTARRDAFSPTTEAITEVEEIDETYQDTLKQTASANINRTQLWLCTQKAYIDNLCSDDEVIESFKHLEGAVPHTPDRPSPSSNTSSPQSKKSVRFVEANNNSDEKVKKRISPIHDGTFWAGFKHTKRSQRARDVFQHRQMRAEAEHVRRNSAGKQHAEQLMGKFELTDAIRPTPARPISSFLPPTIDDDEEKEIFARAERERQALQQLQPSAWHTAATKELHGGSLLTSPIVASFKHRSDVRILDLAGQAHCSWAWDVAVTHPQAQVYTTVSSDAEAHVLSSALEGPMNHSVVAAPRTWVLPFPPNHFDVVSARNLYANLRTLVPNGEVIDEWDLTLQECLRVLKPGGYLEFDLLDAELAHPDAATQALGVEFAFKLRTRGYDPASGKTFLPRLKRAGFHDIKRAWMLLPVADVSPTWTDSGKSSASSISTITATATHGDYFAESERSIGDNGAVVTYEPPVTGSTKDVRAITGLVGARQWEQWILKLACEMGREEEECLESVGRALESAGRAGEGAGWRCLVGWARK
jgi:SAM-dependent methyltransferase